MNTYFGVTSGTANSLFSSLPTSKNGINMSSDFLSNYYSIQNGSYKKLVKSYIKMYGSEDTQTDSTSNTESGKKNWLGELTAPTASTSKDSSKTLAEAKQNATELADASMPLFTRGKDSVFQKETVKQEDGTTKEEYNRTKIDDAVKKFVNEYNSVISSASSISSTSILGNIQGMTDATKAYESLLDKSGITVNQDNTLSVDTEKLGKAGVDDLKNIFQGTGSYGYSMSVKASQMKMAAERESFKANTYTKQGAFAYNYASGNVFNSMF